MWVGSKQDEAMKRELAKRLGGKGLSTQGKFTSRLGIFLLLAGAVLGAVGMGPKTVLADTSPELTLFNLTNQDRASFGLPALNWSQDLSNIAEVAPARVCTTTGGRAEDMAMRGYFAHVIPGCNGDLVFSVEAAYGITSSGAAENIGANYGYGDGKCIGDGNQR